MALSVFMCWSLKNRIFNLEIAVARQSARESFTSSSTNVMQSHPADIRKQVDPQIKNLDKRIDDLSLSEKIIKVRLQFIEKEIGDLDRKTWIIANGG